MSSYRDKASAARLQAIQRYAAAHARDKNGALARMALGIAAYRNGDFASAAEALETAKVPELADYVAYYRAAARVELKNFAGIDAILVPTHAGEMASSLSGKAWLIEARALNATRAGAAAVRLLRAHYAELPQPDGDLALAASYQVAGDLPNATDFYQRIYYGRPTSDAANRAAAALAQLKETLGKNYPSPLPQQLLRRANLLLESRDYARARTEFEAAVVQTVGLEREQARVRIGAAGFASGQTDSACAYLRELETSEPEADAERLYYLAACGRRLPGDEDMMAAVSALNEHHPGSSWRLKALVSAGNRYLLVNRPDDYVRLYTAAYQAFPKEPEAGTCHWKVTFHAWMRDPAAAEPLLREHLRDYPEHPTAGAALYFLGRAAELRQDYGAARAIYERLSKAFQNTYYAMLARARLKGAEIAGASRPQQPVTFLNSLALQDPPPVPPYATSATTARIGRSRLLRAAGFADFANSELRFGAHNGAQPALLAIEAAEQSDAPHQALRTMKNMASGYLAMPVEAAPRKFWELLYPLPYKSELLRSAGAQRVDPYLIAGLIRQESEFNPGALSSAQAYGLTQVRPSTGRLYARRAGYSRFSSRLLFQPAVNLRIGAAILRDMIDQNGGKLEAALAAYNAGPNRASEWLLWNTYREPAEFVESIPYTETRDYVQAVLRNADFYKRLYAQ